MFETKKSINGEDVVKQREREASKLFPEGRCATHPTYGCANCTLFTRTDEKHVSHRFLLDNAEHFNCNNVKRSGVIPTILTTAKKKIGMWLTFAVNLCTTRLLKLRSVELTGYNLPRSKFFTPTQNLADSVAEKHTKPHLSSLTTGCHLLLFS